MPVRKCNATSISRLLKDAGVHKSSREQFRVSRGFVASRLSDECVVVGFEGGSHVMTESKRQATRVGDCNQAYQVLQSHYDVVLDDKNVRLTVRAKANP